jgi:hypothetical protein
MGTPISMQGLWRFDTVISADDLELPYLALTTGPLTRHVKHSRIWPARSYFVRGAALAPIHSEPDPLPAGGITRWADDRGETALNVDAGPVWELSVARLDDGGSVVSLLCSHVVADAGSLVVAAGWASDSVASESAGSEIPTVGDDLQDAVAQLRAVGAGVGRSLWRGIRDARHRAELFAAAQPSAPLPVKLEGPPTWREPTAIFSLDSATWCEVAEAHGGTSNTLFTALIAQLVLQIRGSGPVELSMPMALGGDAANSLSAAAISVCTIDECHDLPGLRMKARKAFQAAGTGEGMGPPAGMPEELLQIVGHRVAHKLVPDPGSRDGLASNLGELDGMLTMLAGHRGRCIAARSVHPGLTVLDCSRTRSSVTGWAATAAGRLTICIAIPDPAVAHSEDLRQSINKALDHWDLCPTYW